MINITQNEFYWPVLDHPAACPEPMLHDRPSERVSELLGMDGEPLLVPIPRHAMGFDLRRRDAQ